MSGERWNALPLVPDCACEPSRAVRGGSRGDWTGKAERMCCAVFLAAVVQYLDARDVIMLGATCTTLRKRVESEAVWGHLFLRDFGAVRPATSAALWVALMYGSGAADAGERPRAAMETSAGSRAVGWRRGATMGASLPGRSWSPGEGSGSGMRVPPRLRLDAGLFVRGRAEDVVSPHLAPPPPLLRHHSDAPRAGAPAPGAARRSPHELVLEDRRARRRRRHELAAAAGLAADGPAWAHLDRAAGASPPEARRAASDRSSAGAGRRGLPSVATSAAPASPPLPPAPDPAGAAAATTALSRAPVGKLAYARRYVTRVAMAKRHRALQETAWRTLVAARDRSALRQCLDWVHFPLGIVCPVLLLFLSGVLFLLKADGRADAAPWSALMGPPLVLALLCVSLSAACACASQARRRWGPQSPWRGQWRVDQRLTLAGSLWNVISSRHLNPAGSSSSASAAAERARAEDALDRWDDVQAQAARTPSVLLAQEGGLARGANDAAFDSDEGDLRLDDDDNDNDNDMESDGSAAGAGDSGAASAWRTPAARGARMGMAWGGEGRAADEADAAVENPHLAFPHLRLPPPPSAMGGRAAALRFPGEPPPPPTPPLSRGEVCESHGRNAVLGLGVGGLVCVLAMFLARLDAGDAFPWTAVAVVASLALAACCCVPQCCAPPAPADDAVAAWLVLFGCCVWLPLSLVSILLAVNYDFHLHWPAYLLLVPLFAMALLVFCLICACCVAYARDMDWQWHAPPVRRATGAACVACALCALISLSLVLLALRLALVWDGSLIEIAAPTVVVVGVGMLAILAATGVFWRSHLRTDSEHRALAIGAVTLHSSADEPSAAAAAAANVSSPTAAAHDYAVRMGHSPLAQQHHRHFRSGRERHAHRSALGAGGGPSSPSALSETARASHTLTRTLS
jgi:hypothetical protein